MANGPLHRPKLPGIAGIDSFKRHTFHTSRWDYGYTGSDSDGNLATLAGKRLARTMEMADFEKMEQVRSRVDEIVEDKETADALKPWYRQFCKRPCFHDEYLDTFNRPNVTLVDTEGRGVERMTERGIVANGVEYEVDCIIYATGFEVGT